MRSRIRLTKKLLQQIQKWADQDLAPERRTWIVALIAEFRKLKGWPSAGFEKPKEQIVSQCKFVRNLAGHVVPCTAPAKYGDFCGLHRTKRLKQRPKGCVARNRAGEPCKAVVFSEGLCPTHWQKTFGHDYVRDGAGFRCESCGSSFDYWTVEGLGRDRKGSIKRVAKCPSRAGGQTDVVAGS